MGLGDVSRSPIGRAAISKARTDGPQVSCRYRGLLSVFPCLRALLTIVGLTLVAFFLWLPSLDAIAQQRTARVGVLAYRGAEAATTRWQPLIAYLSSEITGWRFELIPVTLVSASEHLQANELEFLITNPGHFVTLAERYSLSALATRERRDDGQGKGLLQFGTAIFTRADRTDIQTLADVEHKTLAAVSPEAFGGFQMAWYEFIQQGINPFTDFKTIRYKGFPQDAIVTEVQTGAADVGVVRTGLLETLAREGRIQTPEFKVLFSNAQTGFPYLVSSRLYPEWPFAVRAGTDKNLSEAVTVALLNTQHSALAQQHGLKDLWSAPLSYEDVRAVISTYHAKTTDFAAKSQALDRDWVSLGIAVAALLAGLALGILLRGQPSGIRSQVSDDGLQGEVAYDARRERFEKLTPREREILRLICRGEPTKRIAESLHISPKTVEFHRANLLHKTNARSTPRMVQLATRFGFDQVQSLGGTP